MKLMIVGSVFMLISDLDDDVETLTTVSDGAEWK